jgi:hypothetical protein
VKECKDVLMNFDASTDNNE